MAIILYVLIRHGGRICPTSCGVALAPILKVEVGVQLTLG